MCNLTWPFSAKIIAAPTQSQLSRISYKRVSQQGLLGERAFEQVQEILLEREDLGISGRRDENSSSQVQELLHSLQETSLAQAERVYPTASGEGLLKEAVNTNMRRAGRCYRTGLQRPPVGTGSSHTLLPPLLSWCLRCQGGLGSFL